MSWDPGYTRAQTLLKGEQYILHRSAYPTEASQVSRVRFLSYTTCPAVVLVQDARNHRFPCERAALFSLRRLCTDSLAVFEQPGRPSISPVCTLEKLHG